MFCITSDVIDSQHYSQNLRIDEAGGFCSFEGWVRNHNAGQSVCYLEYEAYEALALSEGQLIVKEAVARFHLSAARAVHRVGTLEIGATAVWVGACSPHREEAFLGCRYMIDQIKARVPIWKREHYLSGNPQWIACHHPHS